MSRCCFKANGLVCIFLYGLVRLPLQYLDATSDPLRPFRLGCVLHNLTLGPIDLAAGSTAAGAADVAAVAESDGSPPIAVDASRSSLLSRGGSAPADSAPPTPQSISSTFLPAYQHMQVSP